MLYHFSEEPNIGQFVPRPAPAGNRFTGQPLVWAIDARHAPLYLLPRDCPRVCFWPLPTSTAADVERYFGHVSGHMVIAIETAWLPRLRSTALYRYCFAQDGFEDIRDHGVHVSRATVVPLAVEPLGDLLERLSEAEVELHICPSLVPLGKAIIKTTLHYSLIRMRNAQGWSM